MEISAVEYFQKKSMNYNFVRLQKIRRIHLTNFNAMLALIVLTGEGF